MRILAVFGTRPEAIKMAPVIKAFANHSFFEIKVCVTAQHRSMLDQVLSLYKIIPHYDLDIMKENQTLSTITQMTMQGLNTIFAEYKADWVFVQGDTNTTFAASLAAFYNKISVAHIEAGLRTYDMASPWPEEMNRQLTTRIATLHFAPTMQAKTHLLNEGVDEKQISLTGNTVIDALMETVAMINNNKNIADNMRQLFSFIDLDKKLILVTSHRRENFGKALRAVCRSLLHLSSRPDVQIVYPVHLNPNIKGPVNELLGKVKNIILLPPQDYLPFVYLMMQSYLIVTDSGGIQEEAPSLGKPVLVVRNTTERPEGIQAGTAKLLGIEESNITKNIENLLDDKKLYAMMSEASNPYGDGKAAQRIVERLEYGYLVQ